MKRIFALLMALMLCIGVLTACGDNDIAKKDSESNTKSTTDGVTSSQGEQTYDKELVGVWKLYEDGVATAVYNLRSDGSSTLTVKDKNLTVPFTGEWYVADGKLHVTIKYMNNPTELLVFYYRVSGKALYLTTEDGIESRLVKADATTSDDSSTGKPEESKADESSYDFSYDMTVKHHVELEVKDYGTIKLELDPTYAPITVDNFLSLVEEGFYDGLTFHRIMEGFMIQGGDPDHNGTGGSDTKIKGEFTDNGVENPLSHTRGVISMARASYSMDSASSQFFIVHEDSVFLDGQYAAFGVVTEGMDVVDAIAKDAKPTDNNGTIKFEEQPVITKITVVD